MYWYGNEFSSITGGWSASGYSENGYTVLNATKNTNSMLFNNISSSTVEKVTGTSVKVDVSGYTKLHAVVNITGRYLQCFGTSTKDFSNAREVGLFPPLGLSHSEASLEEAPSELYLSFLSWATTCNANAYAMWLD